MTESRVRTLLRLAAQELLDRQIVEVVEDRAEKRIGSFDNVAIHGGSELDIGELGDFSLDQLLGVLAQA